MKRSVPSVHRPSVAPIAAHANANHEPTMNDRKPRRPSSGFLAAAAAGLAAGAGLGAAGAVVVCVGAGLMPSAGLSGAGFCSDMSPKLHTVRGTAGPFVGGSL